jgi:dCTP deaminase
MMYSNEDIKQALSSGELVITPFKEEMIKGAGITLHLGSLLLKPLPGKVVDVKKKITPDFAEIIITDDKPYELQPGEFLLGHTLQQVTVGPSLGFLIEGRSTLARVGLTIVQTAMLVYPGHKNRAVTLELANHGPNPILLYPAMKIARVALIELKTPSTIPYDEEGKYREQSVVGRPIFKHEFME